MVEGTTARAEASSIRTLNAAVPSLSHRNAIPLFAPVTPAGRPRMPRVSYGS